MNPTPDDSASEYHFSGFRLDARRKKLFGPDGELVMLSARPFDALLALVQHRGEIVSREVLMEAVWPGVFVEENNLSQAISTVRKALNDTTNESHFIRTVPGRGYCFIAQVEGPHSDDMHEALPVTGGVAVRQGVASGSALMLVLALMIGLLVFTQSTEGVFGLGAEPDIESPFGASEVPRPDSRIPNSIAVLPLVELGSGGDDLFAAGLHDEIINQLTRIRSLSVIARSSIVTLLDQGLSTLDATRVLRVESILSGTMRLAGGQARISLQLVDVRTGVMLWSGSYDVVQDDLGEMLSIQGDIALNVAAALKAELPSRDDADVAALPTNMYKAYRYNLAARNAHDHQNYAEEWRLARKAIELDPNFYEALYTFGSANIVLVASPLPGMTRTSHADLALEQADRMIELAPERSEGYALQAAALAMRGDWAGVAAALNTLDHMAADLPSLEYVGFVAMSLGDFDRAIAIYDANLLTEVLNPYARGFLMVALELAGRREEARERYTTGQELHMAWWGNSVNALLALGRHEPVGDIDRIVGLSEELRKTLQRYEDRGAVLAALETYRDAPTKRPLEALFYAALAAEVGEHDLAVELLRTSMQDVWSNIFWAWLPVFDATRQQQSFRDLLTESGLVDYWRSHGWPQACEAVSERDFRCDWAAYPAHATTAR